MTRSFVLATALFLTAAVGAVGMSYAQPETTTPSATVTTKTAPTQTTTTTTTTTPSTSATPGTSATPATPPVETSTTTAVPTPTPMARTAPPEQVEGAASASTETSKPDVQTASVATTGECRTRKSEGAACACLKEPTRVGVATASPTGGRNMCVMS